MFVFPRSPSRRRRGRSPSRKGCRRAGRPAPRRTTARPGPVIAMAIITVIVKVNGDSNSNSNHIIVPPHCLVQVAPLGGRLHELAERLAVHAHALLAHPPVPLARLRRVAAVGARLEDGVVENGRVTGQLVADALENPLAAGDVPDGSQLVQPGELMQLRSRRKASPGAVGLRAASPCALHVASLTPPRIFSSTTWHDAARRGEVRWALTGQDRT